MLLLSITHQGLKTFTQEFEDETEFILVEKGSITRVFLGRSGNTGNRARKGGIDYVAVSQFPYQVISIIE